MKFTDWIKAETNTIETWSAPKVQKATTLLSAFLSDIEKPLEDALLAIVQNGIPVVITALGNNPVQNLDLALTEGEKYLKPALAAAGISLFKTTENILLNLLAARAQIVTPVSAIPAPTTTIPSA